MVNKEQGVELHVARDGDFDNSASGQCVSQTNSIITCHMVPFDPPNNYQ